MVGSRGAKCADRVCDFEERRLRFAAVRGGPERGACREHQLWKLREKLYIAGCRSYGRHRPAGERAGDHYHRFKWRHWSG